MRYLALIADYDGTVASEGRVSERVIDALQRLKTSGRRVILVTGRRLDDLLAVCPRADIFDAIVAENGGLFYDPGRRQETVLGHPPSKQLLKALRAKGVAPLEVGQVVIGTQASQRTAIQDVLWELGLEAQVIANRGAMMILPAGINKSTGLQHARAVRPNGRRPLAQAVHVGAGAYDPRGLRRAFGEHGA